MTYSKPIAMVRVNPNFGPSGRTPPFRKHGFHSFQGLGFDRSPSASYDQRTFVTSIYPVRGLPSGAASSTPREISDALKRVGFEMAEAGWGEGGRIWLRYGTPGFGANPEGQWGNETYRRDKVKEGLTRAARAIGPDVTFGLSDGTTLPAGRSASAPKAEDTSEGQTAIKEKMGSGRRLLTMTTREVQNLLLQKGFSVGSSGADGVWGPATSSAYERALGGKDPAVSVSADKREVTVWESHLNHIRGLPNQAVPSETRVSPTAAPTEPPADLMPDGIALKQWLPWTAAAVALVGVGGYFVYKGRKKRVAANRRRRRRTSRRR